MALATLLVAPALVVLNPGAALACSCAEASTADLVGYADTIAVGQLTALEPLPYNDGSRVRYTATLGTVFKGEPDNPLVFRSASEGSACGLELPVGNQYLFVLHGSRADLCGGTTPVSPALIAEVEAVTGPGEAAPASTPEQSTEREPAQRLDAAQGFGALTAAPWGAVAAGAVALLVVGWLNRGRLSRLRSGGD